MKFIKENKQLVVFILFISILFPIFFLWDSPLPGFIPQEIGITVVGYGGSIIGGFLTIYGVWWTIKDQENKRNTELRLQYRPLIIPETISKIGLLGNGVEFDLNLKNTGRAEGMNIFINVNDRIDLICPHHISLIESNGRSILHCMVITEATVKEYDYRLSVIYEDIFANKYSVKFNLNIFCGIPKKLDLETQLIDIETEERRWYAVINSIDHVIE